MPEIDRVFREIDTFLDVSEGEHLDLLVKVIEEAIKGAKRGYVHQERDDQALVDEIDKVADRLKALVSTPPQDPLKLREELRAVAIDAMVCRRTLRPLNDPDHPGVMLDPRATLFDDTDMYAFAIHDTLAEDIVQLIEVLNKPDGELSLTIEGLTDGG